MPALSPTMFMPRDGAVALDNDSHGADNSGRILALTGSWCFFALVIVSMRVYTRTVMVKYFGWDDIAIVITMILGLGIWACFVGEAHWALGRHIEATSSHDLGMYYRYQFAHSLMLVWALLGMKIAFMLFLVRLSTRRLFRFTLYAIVGFMTIWTMVSWFAIFFACAPISLWNSKPGNCIPVSTFIDFALSSSVFGMVTDAVLALIPIPIVSGLQLNWRSKACLIIAFGLGMLTVACGVVKTYFQYHFLGNADRLYYDAYFLWGALELYVGIIAASLVSLKPFIGKFIDKAKSTLATSVALAKSLHTGSPRHHSSGLREKETPYNQQFDTHNFPKIKTSSIHSDDSSLPDSPMQDAEPRLSPLFSNPPGQPPRHPLLHRQLAYTKPVKKIKRRPAPIETNHIFRRPSLAAPSICGVLLTPSPTHLPLGESLDFLNLVRGRSPEALQRYQSFPASSELPTPDSWAAPSSLAVPFQAGILASPSPTYLPSDEDLNFFDLIRGRDPETLAREVNLKASRRRTIASILSNDEASRRGTVSCMREYTWLSGGDHNDATATAQTMEKFTAGEVRRRPSIAPSATSVYLCAPVQDSYRDSQIFFHVVPAGLFGSGSGAAAASSSPPESPPESPLCPLSSNPRERRPSETSADGAMMMMMAAAAAVAADRKDSSDLLIKKDE